MLTRRVLGKWLLGVLAGLALLGLVAAGTASGATITEYPIPTPASKPIGIASGPDGALWFTEYNGNDTGRIVPTPQGHRHSPGHRHS